MKKYKLFFIALPLCTFISLLGGCELSGSSMGDTGNSIESGIGNLFKSNEEYMLESFQETMDNDAEFSEYGFIVKEVSLVKKIGNEYNGLVDIEYKGRPRKISITATIDGDNFLWETKPGQFAFVALEELEELGKEFEKIGQELEEAFGELEEEID